MSGQRKKTAGATASDGRLEALRAVAGGALLTWFAANARDLPWRRRRSAYRVWISEAMLQQTRVETATGYYRRFLRRFPSLRALADAPLDAVLKQWEGLGYYARARNLHRAARTIRDEHGGRFPRRADELRTLPGIGPYTAAAVASMAFGEDVAVLDGNVARVLARLLNHDGDIAATSTRRHLQETAQALLPPGRAGDYNEAMMELGATVCGPGAAPRCAECPFGDVCGGRSRAARLPVKRARPPVPTVVVGAAVLRDRRGRVLIAQRRPEGLLGGLWEFPGGKREAGESLPDCVRRELREELGVDAEVGEERLVVRHVFSHFRLEMHVFDARLRRGRPRAVDCAAVAWCETLEDFDRYAFGKADLQVVQALRRTGWDAAAE